ncbi:MoxR-like ATPase in aerotolerance operon [Vibrio chagasii]|uniref:AAA family ATPase n=1 Tax=Vibrio TaxID=662 RepID=UPI000E328CF4|nr:MULTISPECIES: MoxR family ATPase [Vibrio]MCG9565282.1 MoxR family ATPase [Vibrio chagasii]MCG9673999.1 MoxR family ATPase [Vibrio chagasii]NOI84131.1 MoxR family ATPase [Vibrio sp. 99K-1]CAH6832826.1 MoxR-like ATPase in aerotolerance operon [Vibrio chagasii]CAH6846574.1 MoxR-like ATPase in aerotolerance operon [Vibrio chagasii]
MSTDTREAICQLIEQTNHSIIGQAHVTQSMMIALLSGGHILLEGLPGTAKTRAAKILAEQLNMAFSRVQFTPDLLPSDVTGTQIYHQEQSKLTFQPGPIFSSMVLADEINRAPAKVQAALLEAMAEGTVTVAGETMSLPEPFLVIATQNPVEQEGTYPLPEAQMDRFMMKVNVDYPDRDSEMLIIDLVRQEELALMDGGINQDTETQPQEQNELLAAAFKGGFEHIAAGKEAVKRIHISQPIKQYIVDLVMATRFPHLYPDSNLDKWIDVGVSPRASIALDKCSRAQAWLVGRDYVTPDDVRAVVVSVLGHRITPSFDALSNSVSAEQIVDELLLNVPLS